MGFTVSTTITDPSGNRFRVLVDGEPLEGVETYPEAYVFGFHGDETLTIERPGSDDSIRVVFQRDGDRTVLDESKEIEDGRYELGTSSDFGLPEIVVEYLVVATDGGDCLD